MFAPGATVIELGTVTLPIEERDTAVEAAAAAPNVTVHVDAAPGAREVGVHVKELIVVCDNAGVIVIVPGVEVMVTLLPSGPAPTTLVTPKVAVPEPLTVADIVATTPSGMAVVFIPLAMQMEEPAPLRHVMLLFAAVKAGPAETEIPETFTGYGIVHSRAATLVLAAEANERFRDTMLPETPVVEETVRDD